MSAIDLRNVTVKTTKHGVPDLENVDLAVPDASLLTVLGPAGAGKTALIRVLTGLDYPSSGDILFDDFIVNAVSPRERDVATVMQDYPLVPHRNGYDNVGFAAKLRRSQDRQALNDAVADVVDELGLVDVAGLRPKAMTDAERQRVVLGRALVRDANLYVLDEPFSALNERMRSHIRSVVVNRQRRLGRTTIITTSDPAEAMALGAPVVVMHQGIVHQIGSVRQIHAEPANLFVAALFAAQPMNLVAGTVRGDQLEFALGTVRLPPSVAAEYGDADMVIAGFGSFDCRRMPTGERVTAGSLHLAGAVAEVQWQGATQHVLLGFELDEETEILYSQIEQAIEFTMFQPYITAQADAAELIHADDEVSFTVPRERVLFFDPLSGARLQ